MRGSKEVFVWRVYRWDDEKKAWYSRDGLWSSVDAAADYWQRVGESDETCFIHREGDKAMNEVFIF